MKLKTKLFALATISLLFFKQVSISQAPNLGMAANFTLFTVTGAMTNTAVSVVTGNIGTNTGPISGFGIINGGVYTNTAITRQCSTDVIAAYAELVGKAATSTSHTPAFGGGETLMAGVYSIAAAGSIAGVLNLDAQGDPNALFVFKFGGAFTTGAASTVNLINGASACNVYWGADGAIAMAATTIMKGTLIANNGAISMGDGGTLEGRMLSTTGAVSIYGVYAYNSCGFVTLPVGLESFTGACNKGNAMLQWSTSSETDNHYFIVEHSADGKNWEAAGTVKGAGNSSIPHTYYFTDSLPFEKISYYRLKQTNFDGRYNLGEVIAVKKCEGSGAENFIIYPNPSRGKFDLSYTGNRNSIQSIEVFNSLGQTVCESKSFQQTFDLSGNKPGVYFINIRTHAKAVYFKVVIKR